MSKEHNIYGGGAKTNINGLSFEKKTSLEDALKKNNYKVNNYGYVYNRFGDMIGLSIPKHSLYKNFLEKEKIDYKKYNSKKWLPDEAFLNFKNNTIYIIEKKYQEGAGSVDEKLPNCDFKKKEYEKLFNPLKIKVKYIYVFNNWYSDPKYKDALDYIKSVNCDYYFEVLPFDVIGL